MKREEALDIVEKTINKVYEKYEAELERVKEENETSRCSLDIANSEIKELEAELESVKADAYSLAEQLGESDSDKAVLAEQLKQVQAENERLKKWANNLNEKFSLACSPDYIDGYRDAKKEAQELLKEKE